MSEMEVCRNEEVLSSRITTQNGIGKCDLVGGILPVDKLRLFGLSLFFYSILAMAKKQTVRGGDENYSV